MAMAKERVIITVDTAAMAMEIKRAANMLPKKKENNETM
jgi:hypothetical protein